MLRSKYFRWPGLQAHWVFSGLLSTSYRNKCKKIVYVVLNKLLFIYLLNFVFYMCIRKIWFAFFFSQHMQFFEQA